MGNIKNCPFCGGKVEFMSMLTGMKMFYCKNYQNCGAVVSFDNPACNLGGDKPKIRAWNRRAKDKPEPDYNRTKEINDELRKLGGWE